MDEAFDLAVSPPRPTVETPSPGMTVNVGGLRVRTTSEGGSSVEAQAARTTPKTKLHVVEYAFKKAVGGGMAGAIAMVLNGTCYRTLPFCCQFFAVPVWTWYLARCTLGEL